MVVTKIRYTNIVFFWFVLCPVAALPFLEKTGVMSRTATDLYGMALLLTTGCVFFLPKKETKINAADVLLCCFLMICCVKPGLQFDMLLCAKNMSLMLGYIAFRMLPAGATSWLLASALAASLTQSVYGFVQFVDDAESVYRMFRITGSFLNPAHLAFLLSIGTTIAAGMFLFPQHFSVLFPFGKGRLFRVFSIIVSAWLAFVLALTESRTAWIGTFVSVSLLIYLRYVTQRFTEIHRLRSVQATHRTTETEQSKINPELDSGQKLKIILALLLCLLCVGGYALYHYKKDSADGRLLIWKITAEMMVSRPVTGNGEGAFRSDYLYAQATYFAKHPDTPERMLADNTYRPFNEYLRIWYEHGLAGLLLFAAIVCLALLSPAYPVSPVLKAILTVGAIFCFFSYPLEIWCIKVYLLMVLALQAKTLRPFDSAKSINPELTSGKKSKIVNGIYAVVWCTAAACTVFYSLHLHNCQTILKQKTENAAEIFAASYPVWYHNHEYISTYIRLLRREGKNEEALKQMEALARQQPSSGLWCSMGDMHLKEQRCAEAERCYLLAHDMTPAKLAPLQLLLELYTETGQTEKAKKIAKTIVNQPVKVKTNVTDQIKKEAMDVLK